MPKGQLYINGYDAYQRWGMSLADGSLGALMTPPQMKDRISNESRLEHGTRYMNHLPRVQQRDVTLEIHFTASSNGEFMRRYQSFSRELEKGELAITTSFQPGVVYRMLYVSCNQFTPFMRRIAKFSLKLVEPNPKDRS